MKEQKGEDGVEILTADEGKEKKTDVENYAGSDMTGMLLRKWEEVRKVGPDENQACLKIHDKLKRLKKEDKRAKKRLSQKKEGLVKRQRHSEGHDSDGEQWLAGVRARTDMDGERGNLTETERDVGGKI